MSTNSNSTATPPPKRKPGRPKMIKPPPPPACRKGVVSEPSVASNVLELIYDEPMNIKRIFNLFKLVDMRDIRMEFKLSGVRISGAGHLKSNFIDLNIDSYKMEHYYCRHPIIMIIDQRNLEKVMQKVDKSYNQIYFIAKQDSYTKEITIVLKDKEQGVDDYNTISLLESSSSTDDNIIASLSYEDYPLSFTLSSKYFKKVISDIGKSCQDFTIERSPGTELVFPYDYNGKTLDVRQVFTNPEIFQIKSTMGVNGFLSTTIRIEYIQSLANALLSDYVNVYVDHESMTVFKTILDDGAFTLILAVKIVSYK